MTKIKFCGLSRPADVEAANELKPEYIGFVFAPGSKRYVSPEQAARLKALLNPKIQAVGVFVNEQPQMVAELLNGGVIDLAQLHGNEDEAYIKDLRKLTKKPLIQAFSVKKKENLKAAEESSADLILLDSGTGGTGTVFDWELMREMKRPYLLAGGLTAENVGEAVRRFSPFAVDVSSGIETEGKKDKEKMKAVADAVRKENRL